MNGVPMNLGVAIAKGCQPETSIRPGIFFVADSDTRLVEQPYDRGENSLSR